MQADVSVIALPSNTSGVFVLRPIPLQLLEGLAHHDRGPRLIISDEETVDLHTGYKGKCRTLPAVKDACVITRTCWASSSGMGHHILIFGS